MAANSQYARLTAVLGPDDLEKLSNEVKDRLESFLVSNERTTDDLKAQIDRVKIDADQTYFELEKQVISCNSKLESTIAERNELQTEKDKLGNELKSTKDKVKKLEETREGNLSTQLKLEKSNAQLETEKRELVELLEKKSHEIERLNDEWSDLSEKLGDANTAKIQAQAKLDEILEEDVSTKYRERRLQQEKEMQNQQNEWLNKELREKTDELLALRKAKSSQVLSLKSEVESKNQEIKHLQDTVDSLRSTNETQNTRIESLIQKVKDVQDNQVQNEEQFHVEIQAQSRLTELYKSVSEESKLKEKELQTAVEELQKLLKQSSDQHSVLEESMKFVDGQHVKKEKELDEKIEKMERELEHANDLLAVSRKKEGDTSLSEDQLISIFPTAAATSSQLKSGMTLTQIYSSYVEVSDALALEKQENGRLNQYLDDILKEIEEKAPIMQQQREDYEKLLQTVDQLSRKLDAAMLENEQQRIKTDESERKVSQQTRENSRLRLQTSDLGRQVRILLKEVEEARGGHVSTAADDANISSSDVSSSSHIITEKLVSFRNIEELQEQNERLLSVVRDLSEKKEEEERVAKDTEFAELNERLDKAIEEIDELRSARNRQAEIVEGIVRQRDMYRVLLTQKGDNVVPLMTPSSTSPIAVSTPAAPSMMSSTNADIDNAADTTAVEATAALKQLQIEFDQYRKEKSESEKMLNENLEKMREQVSDFRIQNAKLSSQLEFSGERFKILQSNVEGYKKEIEGLRERNQKYTTEVVNHQQTINTLTQDLMATQEKFARAGVMLENTKAERDVLKNVEMRLQQENESLRREQRGQSLLLTNLQTIKNNLERADFENKSRLTSQVEFLEREVSTARRKLESESEQHKAVTKSWESQVTKLRDQLDTELHNHQKTREEIDQLKSVLKNVKQECSEAEAKLAAAEVRLSELGQDKQQEKPSIEVISTTASDEEIKDLKIQINQNEAEIKALKEQIQKAKEQGEQYKSISSAMEESLREQNAVNQLFKETTELRLKEAAETRAKLESQVLSLEKEKRELINEKTQLQKAVDTQTADLRKNLAELQNELKQSLMESSEAKNNEQAALRDSKQQAKLAAEAQDKYEREFLLHAADVQQLSKVKEQLAGFNSKLSEAEEKAKRAENELSVFKASYEEILRIQKDETTNFQTRCKELEQQNTTLHDQLEALSQQLVAFQQGQGASQSAADISFSEDNKSSEQLLEIIRFMRRDRDIAETKCEVAHAESVRHKQKCDYLERELDETKKNLQEERERSQVTARSAAQHQQLMKKIETLNVLTDSNKLLREEKDRLEQQRQQLECKVKELESAVTPLQEQNREMSDKNVALLAEKDSLTSEVKRWKARTNHLIEQSNKTDPEEAKRLVNERESNRKTIAQLTEENQRQKAEMSRLNSLVNSTQEERESSKKAASQLTEENQRHKAEISRLKTLVTNAQTEIRNSKAESTKVKEELQNLKKELLTVKKDLESKTAEMEEKNRTITQVKKIGRRYKAQYEELKKKVGEESTEEQPAAASAAAAAATATAAAAKNAELENQLKSKDEQIKGQTEEINTLKSNINKLTEDLTKMKESEESTKAQLTEKEEKTKRLLMNARQKITQLTEKRDKQSLEIDELKGQVSGLEKSADEQTKEINDKYLESQRQLEQTRESKEQLEKVKQELQQEVEQLKQKLQEVNKQLEQFQAQQQQQQQQQQPPQQVVAATERPSTTREEPPPTANIKPMATPGPSSATKPTTSSAGQAKVTASIRPMAISSATATVTAVSQTPTATVMPTTIDSPASLSQSENAQEPTEQPSETPVVIIMPSPVQAVQPTQQTPPLTDRDTESVQAVQPTQQTPALSDRDTDSVQAVQPTQQTAVSETEVDVEEQEQEEEETVSQEDIDDDQQTDRIEEIPQQVQTDAETPASLPQIIITPTDPESTIHPAPASTKRPREEFESEQEQEDRPGTPEGKKQKIETVEELETVSSEILEVSETREETKEQHAEEQITETEHEQPEKSTTETAPPVVQEEEDDDDVIIVLDSDSEEQYQGEEGHWPVKEEEEDEDVRDGYEGEEEEDDVYDDGGYEQGDVDVAGGEDFEVVDAYEEGEVAEMEEEEEEEDTEVEGMDEEVEDEVEQEQQMDDGDDDAVDGDEEDVEIIGDDDDDHVDQVDMEDQSEGQPDSHQPPGNGQPVRQPPQIQINVVPPEPEQAAQGPPSHQQPSPQQSSHETSGQPVSIQRLPLRTERLTRQLPQFSFVGQTSGAPFDDVGDDCTVPSTPTLFVPKRTDGFAEALNSPQIQHNRFQFNPPEEGPRQVLAQLATQGALGMDDTHIDILGEDEGSGRSVPTTPLQAHSPVVQFPTPETGIESQEESCQSVPVSVIESTVPGSVIESIASSDSVSVTPTTQSSVQFVELDTDSQEATDNREIIGREDSQSSAAYVELETIDTETEEVTQEEESGQGESVLELAEDEDGSESVAITTESSTGSDQKTESEAISGNGSSQDSGSKPKPARIVWSDSDARRPNQGQSSTTASSASTSMVSASHQPRPGYQRQHMRGASGRRFIRRPMSRGSGSFHGRGHPASASRGNRGGQM
ncbi:nucleoprotein TPR-like [Ptychodera flava]|uniref:nucleoprotein TPR-like n=1 Tax=Ptychodera flava TaxID=63121 RepID=UPI00396A5E22